jgi:hypothetical protein
LGKVVGWQSSEVKAVAVAYIGFAGDLQPQDVDQPIAICEAAVTLNNVYTCGKGTMLASGGGGGSEDKQQTAGWTDFMQTCQGAANANALNEIVCGDSHGHSCTCGTGNPVTLDLGGLLETTNGTQTGPSYDALRDYCWWANPTLDLTGPVDGTPDGVPDQPWEITLPVVKCEDRFGEPGNDIGICDELVGAVTMRVVWMTRTGAPYSSVPKKMGAWPPNGDPLRGTDGFCTGSGEDCWNSFVRYFNLQDILQGGTPATYENKTMYFLPSCEPHPPAGRSGGKNFGILAKIPVLVK